MKTIRTLVAIGIINLTIVIVMTLIASFPIFQKSQSKRSPVQTPRPSAHTSFKFESELDQTSTIPSQKSIVPVASSTPDTQISPTIQSVSISTSRCVIVIEGFRYDITEFRSIHSGGDIFQCGTDMSAIFWSQHDTEILQRLGKYRQ